MEFFKRYLLGIGIGVILVVILLMLPIESEQEKKEHKEDTLVEIEPTNQYVAELISFKDSEGKEVLQEKEKVKEPQKRYRIKKDDKIQTTFRLSLKEETSKYPLAQDIDLASYQVNVNADDRYLFLDWITEVSYDEKTGLLTSSTTYQYSQNMSSGDGYFQLKLISSKDEIQNKNAQYTYFYVDYEDIHLEENIVSENNESQVKEKITPSIPSEEPEELIITEGNVEDWDHILDDWEIEEAKWEDTYYE